MGNSHAYQEQADAYIEKAQSVLMAHGVCQDQNDCRKRHLLFWDGGEFNIGPFEFGGVDIFVYKISDPQIIGDIVAAFGEVYKTRHGPSLTVKIYANKHLYRKNRVARIRID